MTFHNLKKGSKTETSSPEKDDKQKRTVSGNPEEMSIDTSFLTKLMSDDEKFKETLVKMNDRAVQDIQNGNCDAGLQMLERLKKVLEFAAEAGRPLDRNMIIVCLYNTACAYQMGWVLEKCAEYIDAVIYNLDQSIQQDDVIINSSTDLSHTQQATITCIKIRKQKFLLKVYLQCCAVLSQLSKHEEALSLAHKAQRTMISILSQCASYCKETSEVLDKGPLSQSNTDLINGRPSHNVNSPGMLNFDFYKNFENNGTFYDEVPYLKNIMNFAIPFLNNFIATVKKFTGSNIEETLKQTRKLLFNWKNNPENTEKYLRKEFGKANFLKENEEKNRSILGLPTTPDWLKNLNIGSFMHMKPMKYKEYAERKELISELSKESLQEKVILQSLIYFSTATEIRFIGMEEVAKPSKDQPQQSENLKISEAYHLTAIELVCKYINGVCPYVNHLIASYQKHYNQDLETIPEESFYSLNEEGGKGKMRIEDLKVLVAPAKFEDDVKKKKKDEDEEERELDREYREKEKERMKRSKFELTFDSPESKFDPNLLRRGSEVVVNAFKKEQSANLIQRVKSAEKQKDSDKYKKTKDERTKVDVKKFDVRSKKAIKDANEAKKIFESSLSSTSLTFGSVLSKTINAPPSQNSSATTKSRTMNTSKNEVSLGENNETYFVKKGFDIPSLGLNKVLKQDNKTQVISERKDIQPMKKGFISDRSIQQTMSHDEDTFAGSGATPSLVENGQNGANFYLYKNLSKFIQSLGNKAVEPIRSKSKKKLDEKTVDNPYKKINTMINPKKVVVNKGTSLASNNFNNQIGYGKLLNTDLLKTDMFSRRATLEKDLGKVYSISPRKDKNFDWNEINKKRAEMAERPTDRQTVKTSAVLSPRSLRQMDTLKHSSSKEKMKLVSPRNR